MKKDIRGLLADFRRRGKALPAFNYSDIWDLKAIINAASRFNIPVMVAANPLVARCLGIELCQCLVERLRAKVDFPVFSHLDHSSEVELCISAINAGYDSVMIDGSSQGLDKNIEMVSRVVEHAKKKGILVEAEIGRIKGKGIEGSVSEDDDYLAEVEDVVALVESTGVDILAVGIGTAHGFYSGEPKIRFDRLEEIAQAVSIPLVLHGGTGIPDDDIKRAIQLGITKVNIGTIIHTTYMNHLLEKLQQAGYNPYTLDIMTEVMPEIERVVEDRIRAVTGS
jgi:ketose-bisphosphate aldolase